FRYWYEKERDLEQEHKLREGRKEYNLTLRPAVGTSTHMAHGPGAIYQIDATTGDIQLVHSLRRDRCIGRPTIYVVIDVFSRLIVGLNVSLEPPSWVGAMVALENATTDKVAYCARFGIDIAAEDW